MNLKNGLTSITIDDNSAEAQKIRAGHDYDITAGKIIVGEMGKDITNKWQAINALKNATPAQMKDTIIKIIDVLL